MAQGQAAEQPSLEEMADSFAGGVLKSEGFVDEEDKTEEEAEAEAQPETEEAEETESEAAETETEEESQPDRWKFTVKAEDGSDVEVDADIDELKKGYMLEKSYRSKTAQLARDREASVNKVREAVEPKIKELDEKLGMAEAVLYNTLAPEMNNTDWSKLAEEDPAEWARKKQKVEGFQQQLGKVQAERQKLLREAQENNQKSLQKQIAETREILTTEVPGWSDELYGRILKSGVDNYGFKPDEINAITDAKAIKVLHDAMQYRALKAKPPGDKKVVVNPKVAKPGSGEKADPKASKLKDQQAHFRKTGKRTDAQSWMESILEASGE